GDLANALSGLRAAAQAAAPGPAAASVHPVWPAPVSPPALLVCALRGGLDPRRQLPRDRAARAGERGAGRVAGAVGGGGRVCAPRRAGGRPRGALWVARARGG